MPSYKEDEKERRLLAEIRLIYSGDEVDESSFFQELTGEALQEEIQSLVKQELGPDVDVVVKVNKGSVDIVTQLWYLGYATFVVLVAYQNIVSSLTLIANQIKRLLRIRSGHGRRQFQVETVILLGPDFARYASPQPVNVASSQRQQRYLEAIVAYLIASNAAMLLALLWLLLR